MQRKDFKGMSSGEVSSLGSVRDEIFKILSDKELSYNKVKIILDDINLKYEKISRNSKIKNGELILEQPKVETVTVYQNDYPWWLIITNAFTALIAVIIAIWK